MWMITKFFLRFLYQKSASSTGLFFHLSNNLHITVQLNSPELLVFVGIYISGNNTSKHFLTEYSIKNTISSKENHPSYING